MSTLELILQAFMTPASFLLGFFGKSVFFAAWSEFHKASYSSLSSELTAFFSFVDDIHGGA